MCVSCDLLLRSNISSFLFISLRLPTPSAPRTSPLLSRVLLYMIEDTFLLSRALFYVIEDVLFSRSTFYFTSKMVDACACVYACASVLLDTFRRSLVFFPLFQGRVTPSLSLHKQNDSSPRKLDFPLVSTFYLFFSLLHSAFFCRFIGRIPSMFLPPSLPSNSFNFAHFCFLKHFFVSLQFAGDIRKILFFDLLFRKIS